MSGFASPRRGLSLGVTGGGRICPTPTGFQKPMAKEAQPPITEPLEPSAANRLDSWKEISAYLKRDVRTLRRWEQDEGLPVYRHVHKRQATVYAYRRELDAWWNNRRPRLEEQEASARVATRRWMVIGFSGALSVALLGLGVYLWLQNPFSATVPRLGPTVALTNTGGRLVALDSAGRQRWIHEFPRPVEVSLVTILIFDASESDIGSQKLCAFSHRGKLLWEFEPGNVLEFGSGKYGPPWKFRGVSAHLANGATRIAVSVAHLAWWPSQLFLLDARGRVRGNFVNSGWIHQAHFVPGPTGTLLLVTGESNSYDGGFLAVLDAEKMSAASPERPASSYDCKSCPPGRPLRYLVFPRSEVNKLVGFHKKEAGVQIVPDVFRVLTLEFGKEMEGYGAVYEFSRDFELRRTSFDDRYWELHRRLEMEGKLKHSREQCPDRFGPRFVLAWNASHGWRQLRPSRLPR